MLTLKECSETVFYESALIQILQDLGPFNMLTVKGCSEMVFCREWANQFFDSL